MKKPISSLAFLPSLFIASCFIASCIGPYSQPGPTGNVPRGNPPPQAPAVGLRRQQAQLQFNQALGVYVVAGLVATYFINDQYLRFNQGRWQKAVSSTGPWLPLDIALVPLKLVDFHGKKGGNNGKGKGKGKFK